MFITKHIYTTLHCVELTRPIKSISHDVRLSFVCLLSVVSSPTFLGNHRTSQDLHMSCIEWWSPPLKKSGDKKAKYSIYAREIQMQQRINAEEIQGMYHKIQGKYRVMQGKYRRNTAGKMQGKYGGITGEIKGKYVIKHLSSIKPHPY